MGGVGLGFGLIIAGFQHGFLYNFGSGESGFFGNFASGVNFFFFFHAKSNLLQVREVNVSVSTV